MHLLALTGLKEKPASHQTHCKFTECIVRIRLYSDESEIYIASRWLHRESNLLFTMGSEKDQRKKSLSRSLLFSINEPLLVKFSQK